MRVVIDTNVFVSSFFGGNPKKIIDLWKTGKITLCISGGIISEYTDVLIRMGLENKKELEELLNLFKTGYNSLFISKTPALLIVEEDPDDNKFIEAAVALDAEFIISGDKHLKDIGNYAGIKIVDPQSFLDLHL